MLQNISNLTASFPSAGSGSASVRATDDAEKSQASSSVRTEPGQEAAETGGSSEDTFELSREAQEIRQLQRRDKEVRAHEAAHAAAGGQYAGSPNFSYTKGADGRTYATAGEVSIDISAVPGDPEATLQKANQVRSAALAPATPSSQDMKVAQKAQMMANNAQQEIAQGATEGESEDPDDSSFMVDKAEDSAVVDDAQQQAKLQDSAYRAYAGDLSAFISFNAYS